MTLYSFHSRGREIKLTDSKVKYILGDIMKYLIKFTFLELLMQSQCFVRTFCLTFFRGYSAEQWSYALFKENTIK